MSGPKFVIVEVRDPETNAVLWKRDDVPIDVLMRVAAGLQQGKQVASQVGQAVSDVSKAVESLKGLFGGKR